MNERYIKDEQERIDSLDDTIDKSVGNGLEQENYSEVIFDRVNEVLLYMDVLDVAQQDILQTEILGILSAIDAENISFLVGELHDETQEWMQIVDSEVDQLMSEMVRNLNLDLNLDASRDYALKMKQNNVDPQEIVYSMNIFLDLIDGIESEFDENLKYQVFANLVNGERSDFIPDEVFDITIALAENQIKEDQELIKQLHKQSIVLENNIKTASDKLILIAEQNNEWFSFMDDEVNSAVLDLETQYANLQNNQNQIDEVDLRISENLTRMLAAKFLTLKNSNVTNREQLLIDFVLRATLLAPNNLPKVIDEYYIDVEGSHLSEFEQGLFMSDFDKAREVLESNMRMVTVLDANKHYSVPDLFRTFRDVYDSESQQASSERQLLSSLGAGFSDSSAARTLLNDGYRLVQLTDFDILGQVSFEGGYQRSFLSNLFLVKQMEDGSYNYVSIYPDGSLNTDNPEVSSVTHEEEKQMVQTQRQNHENLQVLMERNPEIVDFREAVSQVNFKLNNVRTLLSGLMRGEKTQETVNLVRVQALELQTLMSDIDLDAKREAVVSELAVLMNLANMGADSELIENIQDTQQAVAQMYRALNTQDLNRLFQRIQSQDFSVDNWFLQTALPMLGAVAAGVAAVLLAVPSGGTSLLTLAVVGTVGGMAGYEFTTAGVELTTDVETRTMLGSALMGSKLLNPETGNYENVEPGQLIKTYGNQFVVGTIQTFALMGAGRFVGKLLSRFANKNALAPGMRGFFARGLHKIPRIGRTDAELLRANGASGFISRFTREFGEELTEEAIEAGAYQIHPSFGFLASVLVCTRMNNMRHTLAGHQVVSSGIKVDGNIIESNFSYDADSQSTIVSDVQSKFADMNVEIDQDSGVVSLDQTQVVNGQEFTVRIKFEPSSKPVFVRQLESGRVSGIDASAQEIYGLTFNDNVISYTSEGGGEYLSLQEYIESQGGIIVQNLEGNNEVRFGNESYLLLDNSNSLNEAFLARSKNLQRKLNEEFNLSEISNHINEYIRIHNILNSIEANTVEDNVLSNYRNSGLSAQRLQQSYPLISIDRINKLITLEQRYQDLKRELISFSKTILAPDLEVKLSIFMNYKFQHDIVFNPEEFQRDLQAYVVLLSDRFSEQEVSHFRDADNFESVARIRKMSSLISNVANHSPMVLRDFFDLEETYALVDGSDISTPQLRLNYLERISNLDDLNGEWYLNRPQVRSDSDLEGFVRLKSFSSEFATQNMLPQMIEQNLNPSEIVLKIHEVLFRGSQAQFEKLRDRNVNYAGVYRDDSVTIQGYIAPDQTLIEPLMSDFDNMFMRIDRGLMEKREEFSSVEFQEHVIQFAALTQQIFCDIHPMADGNGRTSRILYSYVIAKYLGMDSKYLTLPMTSRQTGSEAGSETSDYDLQEIMRLYKIPYGGIFSQVSGTALKDHINSMDFQKLREDELMRQYQEIVFNKINN